MRFSRSNKSLVYLCMLLGITGFITPLQANAVQPSSPPAAEKPMPPANKPPHDHHEHRDCPCKRPFRRFTMAMENLKADKLIGNDDIKKAYDALMKIPPETLNKAKDKDLAAAEMLYKDKILTEEQYKKICDFLKQNPPKNN